MMNLIAVRFCSDGGLEQHATCLHGQCALSFAQVNDESFDLVRPSEPLAALGSLGSAVLTVRRNTHSRS